MSDIVVRLRDKHCCDASKCNCDEAADEIEKLRAALKQARRKALEEAANIADSCAADWTKSATGKYLETRWDYESRADAGEEIAAAIRLYVKFEDAKKLREGWDKAADEIEELKTAVQYAIKLLDYDLSMAAQKFLLKALGEK